MGVGGVVEVDAAFEDRVLRYAQVAPDRGHWLFFFSVFFVFRGGGGLGKGGYEEGKREVELEMELGEGFLGDFFDCGRGERERERGEE